jgi:hypothetical protein
MRVGSSSDLAEPRGVLAAVKTSFAPPSAVAFRPVLTAAARGATPALQVGTEKRPLSN